MVTSSFLRVLSVRRYCHHISFDFRYETRTIDRTIKATVNGVSHTVGFHVTAPFSATHTGVLAYANDTGTTENEVCSRKGLCDDDTGLCSCFAG